MAKASTFKRPRGREMTNREALVFLLQETPLKIESKAALARHLGWPVDNTYKALTSWETDRKIRIEEYAGSRTITIHASEPLGARKPKYIPVLVPHYAPRSLYVIGSEIGRVKVGRSHDPQGRLHDFQVASPCLLSLEYAGECQNLELSRKIEERAHELLHEHRYVGEWFNVRVAEAVAAIERAATEFGYELHRRLKPKEAADG
jgi:T5orf172 domain